jgi:hypothetical protein
MTIIIKTISLISRAMSPEISVKTRAIVEKFSLMSH